MRYAKKNHPYKYSTKRMDKQATLEPRHYGEDKKFHYHQQSIEYINRKLGEQPKKSPIDPGQSTKPEFIDQNNVKLSSKVKNMADPMGFEPMTFSLEG